MDSPSAARLVDVLEKAKEKGFLGPGSVEAHISHADRFVAVVGDRTPKRVLDLGSGGGIPGLVLANQWQSSSIVLLDAADRRTRFLREAVELLELGSRVTVVCGRAEEQARIDDYRWGFDLVVARSFGAPAVVAECASGFLETGGLLIVSEPPETTGERWQSQGLAKLGMRLVLVEHGVVIISQDIPCDERYPRRDGVPSKRPLF